MYSKKLRDEKIFLWTLFVENASSTTCQKKASLSQGGFEKVIVHTSQQTTLLSKTGFRPVFSCAPLLLLFPKNLTLFGDPDKKRWMSVCFLRKQEGFEPVRA